MSKYTFSEKCFFCCNTLKSYDQIKIGINFHNYQIVDVYDRFQQDSRLFSESELIQRRRDLNYLLLWAGEIDLEDSYTKTLRFLFFLNQVIPGPNRIIKIHRIIENAQRFFNWAKSVYYEDFENTSFTWIEFLDSPPKQIIDYSNIKRTIVQPSCKKGNLLFLCNSTKGRN